MSSAGETEQHSQRPSVFLSYASEDRSAASLIRDALAAAGLDVWYDENELGGGDAWDKKIRQQIRECDYFMAIISAQTEARHEGYFRREWRLAVERTLDMADDHTFLLPVVIDNTEQSSARVPERFLAVQWLKVPNGISTPPFKALCSRLLSGSPAPLPAPRRSSTRGGPGRVPPVPQAMPAFPTEEPGQRVKFWFHVIEWAVRYAWTGFRRLPRWIRFLISFWLCATVVSRGCSHSRPSTAAVTPETTRKLAEIADKYKGSTNKGDIAQLGADIAREISKDTDDEDSKGANPFLAVPFLAPAGDPAAAKLADSAFALLFGRLSISHTGKVGLSPEPLGPTDVDGAVNRGQTAKAKYVIVGGIEGPAGSPVLGIEIIRVSDRSVVWTKNYPVASADPNAIATEVESKLPSLDDN
jgi:hypothetical protein